MTAYERMDQLSNNGKSVLTREMLENNGISGNLLSPYAKKRGMERIAPGMYAGDAFVADDFMLLQKRYPKAIFYGYCALYLHGLSDYPPQVLEVICPPGYRIRTEDFRMKIIVHHESKKELFDYQIEEVNTIFQNPVMTYGLDKSIVELIRRRRWYDSETFLKALRRYCKDDERDYARLDEYASMRGISSKVDETMEIFVNEDR